MITYRLAGSKDCKSIAALHAQSWKETYRGSFDDHYLDHLVEQERLATWAGRFSRENSNQHIFIALKEKELVGFVCTYSDFDHNQDTYLDNLHVRSGYRGYGIGRRLIAESAKFAISRNPEKALYLYVLTSNHAAIKAYEAWGGVNAGIEMHSHEGASDDLEVYKFVWHNPRKLLMI